MVNANHEKIVIEKFLEFYNKENNITYKVIKRPDPPDAVVSNGKLSIWIEHCDVYRSVDEAKEDNLEDYPRRIRPIVNLDERIAQKFLINLENKLTKKSYEDAYNTYGKGILVMVIRDCLFDAGTLETIKKVLRSETDLIKNKKYFKEVYITWNNKYVDCVFQKII
ncbi:MAG: hypothetical protein KAT05_09960 [Spirochaetes bacterium]|nr:hypothetical protein [Spirochaetota bacterium]